MAVTGLATMHAGSLGINPGDYLNPNGTVSIGLLPSTGTPSGQTGLVSNPDGITGSNFQQSNYISYTATLFGTQVTTLPQASYSCTVNCQGNLAGALAVAPPAVTGATLYSPAGDPTFDLLGDAVFADRAKTSNAWISTSTGTGAGAGTITIPVGIFGVTDVDTMLNTTGGVLTGGTVCAGATVTSTAATNCTNTAAYSYITFQFNKTDATGLTGTNVYETIALVNGVVQENILDGTCVNGSGSFCSGTGTLASTISNSTIIDPSTSTAYAVEVQNEFKGTTSNNINGANAAANGDTMLLDSQIFPVFSEYTTDYLVSVSITNTGTMSGANYSEEVLSGLTVELPEPSTVLMFLSGFAAIGIARFRRKTAA
jgi:hypothetical protein